MLTIETKRRFSLADRLIAGVDHALKTTTSAPTHAQTRPMPGGSLDRGALSAVQRGEVAGLMRVNHTGEVCAQALYEGQAVTARSRRLKSHLAEAADEERDHLAWCATILDEIGARPSRLNPVWYGASFGMGALAGLAGDRWSLGFLVETERQVEAHLQEHLERLPAEEHRARAVLSRMQEEEAGHADRALAAGARPLPQSIRRLMGAIAGIMKAVAYRF